MDTENKGFRQRFKRGVREIKGFGFRKCARDFLEFLLRSKRYGVTPRPKRVYGIGNRRVVYVHQGLP